MPLPRLPVAAGLVLVLLPLAPVAAPGAGAIRPVIVATGAAAATATEPDGTWRVELPWLVPGDRDVAVSPDGNRVAFASARDGSYEIYVADASTGRVRRLTARPRADDRRPDWSPDGRRLAWQSGPAGRGDVLVMRADGTRKRLLAGGPSDDVDPAWSPDGTRVAFSSNRGGSYGLWAVAAAGGDAEQLLDVTGSARAPVWSRDGARLAYSGTVGAGTSIWRADLATFETARLTGARGAADLRPDWSPDGSRIAFTRSSSGRTRTWTIDAGGDEPARPLDGSDGDADPEWTLATEDVAPGPDELLPDLDQRSPSQVVVLHLDGGFRLGFASAVDNIGLGPLRIRGRRPPGWATMRADQVIELRGGGTRVVSGVGRLRYEAHPPHRHWHFQPFERYELRRASDHALVGRDRKSGFCLIDRYGRASRRVPNTGPPRFVSDCGARQPELRLLEEGSSPGYVDRYPAFFHGQDVDISDVPAGIYVLVHRANPARTVRELRYSNDTASVRLRLTWPDGRARPPRVTVLRRCEESERCP